MARITKAELESQVSNLSLTLQLRDREISELKAELHKLRTAPTASQGITKRLLGICTGTSF